MRKELLLGDLQGAAVPPWPGADGLTVQGALSSYPQAAAPGAGQSVQSAGTAELVQRAGLTAGTRPLGGLTAPQRSLAGQRPNFLAAISNVYL